MTSDVKAMTQVASPPATVAAKEISGDMARKVRQTAKRTMDDVAMTPFLRKITFFSSGGSFLDGYVLSLIGVALTQVVPASGSPCLERGHRRTVLRRHLRGDHHGGLPH